MGHGSIWLHGHHWGTTGDEKATWKDVLQVALVAVLVFIVMMLLFPSATY